MEKKKKNFKKEFNIDYVGQEGQACRNKDNKDLSLCQINKTVM